MAEKFPKLMTNTKAQFHNAQRISRARLNKNKQTKKQQTTKNVNVKKNVEKQRKILKKYVVMSYFKFFILHIP